MTKRYTSPFGAPRGEKPANWPDDKGFLGKPVDKVSGLTHVGAREYDPLLGAFISVDPLLVPEKHQSLNGYAYANNSPVTFSDPTGLDFCGDDHCSPGSGRVDRDGVFHKGNPNPGSMGPGYGGTAPTNNSGYTAARNTYQCGYSCGNTGATGYGPRVDRNYALPKKGPSDNGNWFTAAIGVVAATVLPDIAAWKGCGSDIGLNGNCGNALLDLPFAKPLKFGKGVRKLAKGSEGGSDAVKKGKVPANCKCFLAGTDVLIADGKTKDIEAVKLGDKVLATDPKTGRTEPKKITRLIVTESDKHFNKLSIATGDGIETLTATHEHPFWSPSERRWVEARSLAPGMTLRTDDGGTVVVTKNRSFTKHARTYNLTVEALHTYYVLAGPVPLLVHNSNCDGIGRSLIGDERSDHILDGHRYPGAPGKDAFPKGWSDDQIPDAVADVTTSPSSQRVWYKGSARHAERTLRTRAGDPAVQNVIGTVRGVRILVRYEPLTGKVLTAFPQ
ncbi:hypothetical protein GCM10010252_04730 [Streptomyces aureoverticillatus]|nr:hypothetical protein GCM10010252_04730 [Streptomyces aureoverticillatus]